MNVYSSHRLNQEQDWNPFGQGRAPRRNFEDLKLEDLIDVPQAAKWSKWSIRNLGWSGRCLRLHTFPFDKLFLLHITIKKRFLMNDSIFLELQRWFIGCSQMHIYIYVYIYIELTCIYTCIHSTYNIYNTHIYIWLYMYNTILPCRQGYHFARWSNAALPRSPLVLLTMTPWGFLGFLWWMFVK